MKLNYTSNHSVSANIIYKDLVSLGALSAIAITAYIIFHFV